MDTGGTQVLGLAVTDGAIWAVSYDTSTLVRIDPVTNTVDASVEVPGGASVASLPSGLWVAAYGDPGHLYKIDPATATIDFTADVGDLCCDLTEGAGLVWALDRAGELIGVGPDSGIVNVRIPVELDLDAHNNVVFAGGWVWVSSDTTNLFRFDPHTGERTEFDVGGGVPFLTRNGLLWGATQTELWAVDTDTGEVVRRVPLPDSEEVMALTIDGGRAWVGLRHPGVSAPSSCSTCLVARCFVRCRWTSRRASSRRSARPGSATRAAHWCSGSRIRSSAPRAARRPPRRGRGCRARGRRTPRRTAR